MIKRHAIVLAVFLFAFAISAQEIQHEAIAINIEVPVRVFKGNTFIDNLTIENFEVFEEGVLQNIEAVYFIRKKEIERKEINSTVDKGRELTPNPSRTFVLMFEIVEYLPQIGEVLDYFFSNVIQLGDSFIIATPTKTYNLNSQALERIPKEEIARQLTGRLRQNANLGSTAYRSQLNHINQIDKLPDTDLSYYDKRQLLLNELRHLKQLAYFDVKNATDFADFLKGKQGQKYVFFFFQKRTMPIPKILNDFDEMELLHEDLSLDSDKLKNAYADSSISCHFLYITKSFTDSDSKRELPLEGSATKRVESSGESYRGFSEIAEVTGGLVETSANVSASFQKAVDYSESYYLLYYTPKDYKADGKFKKIKINVKGQNYRITHRAGYIAD